MSFLYPAVLTLFCISEWVFWAHSNKACLSKLLLVFFAILCGSEVTQKFYN